MCATGCCCVHVHMCDWLPLFCTCACMWLAAAVYMCMCVTSCCCAHVHVCDWLLLLCTCACFSPSIICLGSSVNVWEAARLLCTNWTTYVLPSSPHWQTALVNASPMNLTAKGFPSLYQPLDQHLQINVFMWSGFLNSSCFCLLASLETRFWDILKIKILASRLKKNRFNIMGKPRLSSLTWT